MSEATPTSGERAPRKRATSLSTMLLADLKALAGGLGIAGAGSMKKAQLVDAIKQYQDQHAAAPREKKAAEAPAQQPAEAPGQQPAEAGAEQAGEPSEATEKPVVTTRTRGRARTAKATEAAEQQDALFAEQAEGQQGGDEPQRRRRAERAAEGSEPDAGRGPSGEGDQAQPTQRPEAGEDGGEREERRGRNRQRNRDRQSGEQSGDRSDKQGDRSGDGQGGQAGQGGGQKGKQGESKQQDKQQGESKQDRQQDRQQEKQGDGQKKSGNQQNQAQNQAQNQGQNQHQGDDDFDEDGGSRRNRRRRGRDRAERGGRNEPDTTILDDDVLVPAAGILDVLDNYAFVRTSGYLPGPDDVYLSLSMVRKYGLRRGDAVVGQVRQPREGERREKFNPMVRIDTVNGLDPEAAKERPEFDAFVPVHPSTRLRLETGPDNLLGRIVDVLAPIGKGQRGMVLSPPRSGKTQVLQTIAAAIRHNNPECHVMVVLIDERPEEVTDYQRTVRGEVVASTFDRPAADHVLLAELAVERAKRLVEMGHDVVVLLDSLTRLARAFNVTAPGSGRQGAGGVDPVALHPAKRLFGAARNVEDGGSLTILATALVDSGSPLDEAVLDEFNDTGNMELRLRRELVERRIFPPVDVVASGTRREEHLLSAEEQALTFKLRSALDDLEPLEALERVTARMTSTSTNVEFLTQVQKATPAELSGS